MFVLHKYFDLLTCCPVGSRLLLEPWLSRALLCDNLGSYIYDLELIKLNNFGSAIHHQVIMGSSPLLAIIFVALTPLSAFDFINPGAMEVPSKMPTSLLAPRQGT